METLGDGEVGGRDEGHSVVKAMKSMRKRRAENTEDTRPKIKSRKR